MKKDLLAFTGLAAGGIVLFQLVKPVRPLDEISKKAKLRLNNDIEKDIIEIADTIGVPTNIIAAIVVVESGGDFLEEGPVGERGLMQIKNQITLNDVNDNFGTRFDFGQMFSIVPNLAAGCLYYKLQLKRMRGDFSDAIRAYNAGQAGALAGFGFGYLAKVKLWL